MWPPLKNLRSPFENLRALCESIEETNGDVLEVIEEVSVRADLRRSTLGIFPHNRAGQESVPRPHHDYSELPWLISQFVDFIFVHAEVVSEFVQHRKANLLTQFFGIGKIFEQGLSENRDFIGQCGW